MSAESLSLLECVPPLHARVRARRLRVLQERLAALGDAPLPLRIHQLLLTLEAGLEALGRDLATLARQHGEAPDEAARRRVLVEHLRATVPEARRFRGDVRALGRWLGLDVLQERGERECHRLQVDHELLLHALGPAAAAALSRDGAALADRLRAGELLAFLLARMTGGGRHHNRLAAAASLARLARALPRGGRQDATLLERLRKAALADESAWVQERAHAALLALDERLGQRLLEERLVHRACAQGAEDWLLRGQLVELAARQLEPRARQELLGAVVRAGDPSVHVRQTLCRVLAEGAGTDGATLLEVLVGLCPEQPEPSHQVRATALIAAARCWQRADDTLGPRLAALFLGALKHERHPLPLRIACEELALLGEALGRTRGLNEAAPALLEALDSVRTRAQSSPALQEHAAAAQEALACALSAERAASLAALRELVARVAPGGEVSVPARPEEPAEVGRLLAALARRDFGLSLQQDGGQWRLWRGDHFRRRLWRILHELRNPAPNKRQAFRHTLGRRLRGELRAPPGLLHEVTATWVPGERVHIKHEGGWGRHLPTVDDLLDLPLLARRDVRLFSSHGVTTLTPPAGMVQRLRNRLRLSVRYPELAALRLASLRGDEPHERRRYLERVEREHGITVRFTPYRNGVPDQLEVLFPSGQPSVEREQGPPRNALAPLGALPLLGGLRDGFAQYGQPLLLQEGLNGPLSLGLLGASAIGYVLLDAYRERGRIASARASLPLCIGGWGTRGKSGTERLKAALFGGLGFEVFAKTTGSEAMFLHTLPGRAPVESFIYRPYDKATIWEQARMLRLGAALRTEVFLWECMALNPTYVSLLQHDWMRDDLVTLTNAYPDHEDIQGPAGQDVARVISEFIPRGTVALTSEDHFLPLFREVARERGTQLLPVTDRDAELLPDELLARFPYQEHPRNVALVARLAEHLGVERTHALALMSEHVVPEIGVLKVFPTVRLRGRLLSFINGHSANERTGFLNNWRRTGLDAVEPDAHPERAVFTVVNNRWDRVSRSEVFARILAKDASADGHILIGTNLDGLMHFLCDALEHRVAGLEVSTPEELAAGKHARALERLAAHLAWLKIPSPTPEQALARLECFAAGAGLGLDEEGRARLREELGGWLSPDASASTALEDVRRAAREAGWAGALSRWLVAIPRRDEDALPEVLTPATREEVLAHAEGVLVRMAVHARLRARLRGLGPEAAGLADFHARMRAAWRELFLARVTQVKDAHASGDQIVDLCARLAAPGQQVSILGAQNIKGTGLDWVYRWVALEAAHRALAQVASAHAVVRRQGLEALEAAQAPGLLATGLVRQVLGRTRELGPEEQGRVDALRRRYEALHTEHVAALVHRGSHGRWDRVLGQVEQVLEVVDSIRRRWRAERVMRDLVNERITHVRASLELRTLMARQNGGWLAARLARRAHRH